MRQSRWPKKAVPLTNFYFYLTPPILSLEEVHDTGEHLYFWGARLLGYHTNN